MACKGGKEPLYNSSGSEAKLSAPEELETVQMGPNDGERESLKRPLAKKTRKEER